MKLARRTATLASVAALLVALAWDTLRKKAPLEIRIHRHDVEDPPLAIDRYRWTSGGDA